MRFRRVPMAGSFIGFKLIARRGNTSQNDPGHMGGEQLARRLVGFVLSRARAMRFTCKHKFSLPASSVPGFRSVHTEKEWGVKQVTRSNLGSVIQQAKEHIHNADFISISLQSTGSYGAPWRRILPLDTCETAYYKAKDSAERFQLLQFSVCPFKIADSKVTAFPYNFHLFPRDEMRIGMPSYSFSCQVSCLTSMAQHGFDFNACVYDGISYLSRAQEIIVKQQLGKLRTSRTYPSVSSQHLSTTDIIFMERVRSCICHWRDTCLGSSNNSKDGLVSSSKEIVSDIDMFGTRPCMTINALSDHQLQLIIEVLREFSHNLVRLTSQIGDDTPKKVKVVFTNSEEDKYLLLNELQQHRGDQNKEILAFREMIDALTTCGKAVVGYDCLTDFAIIHSKFIAPLPPTVNAFLCSVRAVFPCCFDINHLLEEAQARELYPMKMARNLHAALSYLNRQFFLPVILEVPPEFQRYSSRGAENHGYGALRIAYLFTKLCRLLKINLSDFTFDGYNGDLYSYANTFYPSGMHLNKSTHKSEGNFSYARNLNIVFLWGFKIGSSAKALLEMLSVAYEVCQEGIEVQLVDESCAYIEFRKSKYVDIFLQHMQSGTNLSGFGKSKPAEDIVPAGLRAARFDVYEVLCKSSLSENQLADSLELVLSESKDGVVHASATDLPSSKHSALILELENL